MVHKRNRPSKKSAAPSKSAASTNAASRTSRNSGSSQSNSGNDDSVLTAFATSDGDRTIRRARKSAHPKKKSKVLGEIRKLQRSTHLLIPRMPFLRVVREILQQHRVLRVTKEAVEAMRESSELYLLQLFQDALYCMLHGKRVTMQPRDLWLVMAMSSFNMPI